MCFMLPHDAFGWNHGIHSVIASRQKFWGRSIQESQGKSPDFGHWIATLTSLARNDKRTDAIQ